MVSQRHNILGLYWKLVRKKGSIISVGAIIDHDVCVEEYVHVNAGAICKAGSVINSLEKLEAGQVVLGYGFKR